MSRYLGHGCKYCKPLLFGQQPPIGNANYTRADLYQNAHPGESLAIFLDDQRARYVVETMRGSQGWIVRQHTNAAVLSESGAHECRCGSGEIEMEMYAGFVRWEVIPMPTEPLPLRRHGTLPQRRRIIGRD